MSNELTPDAISEENSDLKTWWENRPFLKRKEETPRPHKWATTKTVVTAAVVGALAGAGTILVALSSSLEGRAADPITIEFKPLTAVPELTDIDTDE